MAKLLTLAVGLSATQVVMDADYQLIAVRSTQASYRDPVTSQDVWPPESILVSADPNLTWTAVTADPTFVSKSVLSFGGVLAFPIDLSKGESIYISAYQLCVVQLILTDRPS